MQRVIEKLADQHWRDTLAANTGGQTDFPGFTIHAGVIDGESCIVDRGLASIENRIPIQSAKTRFHVASLAKQITAYVVLKTLKDAGADHRMRLSAIDPEWPDAVTIGDLLCHRSGIADLWDILEWGGWRGNDAVSWDDAKSVSRLLASDIDPTGFRYCNTGYVLLALISEHFGAKSFLELSREFVFDPLQLNDTFWRSDVSTPIENRAYGYAQDDGQIITSDPTLAVPGPTSLWSTTPDFSSWVRALETGIGLDPVVCKMMRTPPGNGCYGFGLAFNQTELGTVRFHTGRDFGSAAISAVFPEISTYVTIFANLASFPSLSFATCVANHLHGLEKKQIYESIELGIGMRETTDTLYRSEDDAILHVSETNGSLKLSGALSADSLHLSDTGRVNFSADTYLDIRNSTIGFRSIMTSINFDKIKNQKAILDIEDGFYFSDKTNSFLKVSSSAGCVRLEFPKKCVKNSKAVQGQYAVFDTCWIVMNSDRKDVFELNSSRSRNVRFHRCKVVDET